MKGGVRPPIMNPYMPEVSYASNIGQLKNAKNMAMQLNAAKMKPLSSQNNRFPRKLDRLPHLI